MKKFLALTLLSSILLTACGGSKLTVADEELLESNPEVSKPLTSSTPDFP